MNMDNVLKELVETHGLQSVLGGLVKVVGNHAAVVKESSAVEAEKMRVLAEARMLTHCWQFVSEFEPLKECVTLRDWMPNNGLHTTQKGGEEK